MGVSGQQCVGTLLSTPFCCVFTPALKYKVYLESAGGRERGTADAFRRKYLDVEDPNVTTQLATAACPSGSLHAPRDRWPQGLGG